MGSFSMWHWLVLLLLVAIPAALIGAMVWLMRRLSRRKHGSAERPPTAGGKATPAGADARLKRLDALLLAGDITRDEYERQRASIIASV
jgi:hypothetical protein